MEVIPKNISGSEIGPERLGRFFSFIEYCFIHRRKKLINSLEAAFKAQFLTKSLLDDYIDKKDLIVKMLHGIGKGADIRAEHLSLQDFEKLFLSIYSIPGVPIKK
jgi:16S rRNA A1518/A1519 N6-dimethyltransferase RsmA/KsgA/DIM1 with predicted DNA glycosylase/AP lyase activity